MMIQMEPPRAVGEGANPSGLPAVRGLIHYPVTTRFWRGVFHAHQVGGLGRHLRRACDWHVIPVWASSVDPNCADCIHYKDTLRRLGYVRW